MRGDKNHYQHVQLPNDATLRRMKSARAAGESVDSIARRFGVQKKQAIELTRDSKPTLISRIESQEW
jgi:hypothetical protein